MTAQVFYLPTPRTDVPTRAGYYVQADMADLMPYAPVYRLYESGGWLLGGQRVPEAALPGRLVRLVPEVTR